MSDTLFPNTVDPSAGAVTVTVGPTRSAAGGSGGVVVIFPATEKRLVTPMVSNPPPFWISIRNSLAPPGPAPTIGCSTTGSPMYPAGAAGAMAGSHVTKGHGREASTSL